MGKQVTLTDRITGEIIYPVTTLNSVYNLYNTTLSDLLDLINTEIQDRYTKLDIDTLLKGLFTDLSNTSDNKISITVGSVSKTLKVAYAATAGTLNGNADTATNIYNSGTVTLATATESNDIFISQPSYGADKPVKLLNFNWYGNRWALGNIRSGDTHSNGLGIFYGASGVDQSAFTEIGRFTINGWSGNAATATKLQTARTIWGLSFNGSANISGALTGVSTISMSGQLTSTLASGTSPFNITSTTLNSNLNADLLDGQHGSYYTSYADNNFVKLSGTKIRLYNLGTYTRVCTFTTINGRNGTLVLNFVSNEAPTSTGTNSKVSIAIRYNSSGSTILYFTVTDLGIGLLKTCYLISNNEQDWELWITGYKANWEPFYIVVPETVADITNLSISESYSDTVPSGTTHTAIATKTGFAAQLYNARTINGTSFDGTANITTSLWGTARNISIGGTSKSVNGSSDITWALSEISANYATSAGNATTAGGFSVNSFANPFGKIPTVRVDGVMELGKILDFHYDNTTGSDYSTRLNCTGNNSNSVNLPSTTGTLALTSDIPTSVPLLSNLFGSRPASADITQTGSGGLSTFKATSSMITNKPASDGHIIHMYWDSTAGYDSQIFIGNGINHYAQYRTSIAGTWGSWITLLDSLNYNNYSPLINGSHATSSTSIYAPTSLLSVQSATNSYLIGSTSTTSLNTVYSNSSIYMNGSNLYAGTFIGNLTGTASQATNSYNSGIKWTNTVTVGSWSSICLLSADHGAYILTITFAQNSEASCNTYLVNTGYTCALIVQLNSTNFSGNYSLQIRVTQNGSSRTLNFIEVLEPYGYNGATTLNIKCALNRVDNSTIIGVTTYTAHTAAAGGSVWDTITSSKNKMVANLAGTADVATLANTINANSSTTTQAYLLGVTASGTTPIYDPGIYITSTSGTLHATYMTATTFTGNLTGTASNATLASTISSNLNTNTKGYLLALTASGTTPFYDSGIYIGTVSGNLIASTFTGSLSGNADSATVASKLGKNGDSGTPMTFNWSGQSGQPSWLWGGNDGTNMYVYNPSNFNVNHANSASNSDKLGGFTEASFLRERGNWANGANALAGLSVTSWSSKVNYQTDYGNSLHIQGNNTWYNRLDFGTSGRIYFYQAINPSSTTGCMQYTGTLAFLTDIPTLSLTTSGTGNAVSSISVSGHTITLNLTTYNNYSLPTAADSTLGGVKTGYTTSGQNYKVSIDASGNLYTYVPWSDTWNANSVNVAGYVSAPTSSNANKVWKTDANGNPGWRTDLDTTSFTLSMAVSPGTSSITLAFGIKYLLTAGGSTYIFTMPNNPNTNYLTGMYVGAPWAASNSAVTNPYVNIYDTAIYRSKLQLVGAGGTTITSNDSSVITISSDSAGKIWVANSGITTKYTSGLYINLVAHGTTGCFTEVNDANIVLTVESESDGKYNKQLGFSSNGNLYYRSFVNADPDSTTAWKTIIDSGNIGSQAVTSASKLTTAVSIWGKTFDGSSNITGNLVSTGLSTDWTDTWSDGTNTHPWYGYDMNHANTGIYSTTISDYFGMTLKTYSTELNLTYEGGVSINKALTITSGGLNLYTNPLRFQNTSGTTLGIIGMDPGVLNIWGPLASNATTSTGIVLIGKQGGWRCIQIDSSNNTYIGATQSNMTARGHRLYVDGTQYISSTLTTGGNITAPAFYESSDYRLKNSIYTISNADVKLVDKIKLKEYRFNNDPSKKHYGVVAQDLLDLGMNDLVKGDEKSYYSVDYISLLILKMQAMQNKIDELTKKINNL